MSEVDAKVDVNFGVNMRLSIQDADTGLEVSTKIALMEGVNEETIRSQVGFAVLKMLKSMGYMRGMEDGR